MLTTVLAEAEDEPITLADLKGHLRVLHDSEDNYLAGLISAARMHLERTTGAAFRSVELEGYLWAFPRSGKIALPMPPLAAVLSVKYRDRSGEEQTFSPDAYHVETAGFHGRIELLPRREWPATQEHPRAVTVHWKAGPGEDESPADDQKHAMKLLCAHWYANREVLGTGTPIPFAVDALLQKYKTHGWM